MKDRLVPLRVARVWHDISTRLRARAACNEDVVTSGCCLRRFGHADLRSNRADECQLKSPASSFGNVWFQDSAVNITKPTLQSNQLQMIDTGQITTSD